MFPWIIWIYILLVAITLVQIITIVFIIFKMNCFFKFILAIINFTPRIFHILWNSKSNFMICSVLLFHQIKYRFLWGNSILNRINLWFNFLRIALSLKEYNFRILKYQEKFQGIIELKVILDCIFTIKMK
jgi:hypothetical protein